MMPAPPNSAAADEASSEIMIWVELRVIFCEFFSKLLISGSCSAKC